MLFLSVSSFESFIYSVDDDDEWLTILFPNIKFTEHAVAVRLCKEHEISSTYI